MIPDIRVENHGSIVLLRPVSDEGSRWLRDHVVTESWSVFGDAIAAEPRYVGAIVAGAQDDGLVVKEG